MSTMSLERSKIIILLSLRNATPNQSFIPMPILGHLITTQKDWQMSEEFSESLEALLNVKYGILRFLEVLFE